jgi:hypothetical protein
VSDEAALESARLEAKLRACVHCRRVGMLVGHGRLFGYAERSSARELRGRRLLCSRRHRRSGCGHTFSVWLATVVPRRIVRATTIFALLTGLASGLSRASAWRRASSMTLRTGYRIAARLAIAGPGIRTALFSRAPPPAIDSTSPDAQLVVHVRAVLGVDASLADYQLAFQRSALAS